MTVQVDRDRHGLVEVGNLEPVERETGIGMA